jgi:hypothetical protein
MLVMICEILETYVLECWILMFVSEHVGNADRTCLIYGVCEICDICDDYVISFVCLDGITKTIKRCIFVTLPSVTLGKEVLCRVSGP